MSVKYRGNKMLYDDDGNMYDMEYSERGRGDSGFVKMFLGDFLYQLGVISNKKTEVAYWLVEHADRNNLINYTLEDIAKATGVSYKTVVETMKSLKESGLIRKVRKVYMLNPRSLSKAYSAQARRGMMTVFDSADSVQTVSPEKQIANIQKTINALCKRKEAIEAKMKKESERIDQQISAEYDSLLQVADKINEKRASGSLQSPTEDSL